MPHAASRDPSRGRVPNVGAHPSARLPTDIPFNRAKPRPVTDADRANVLRNQAQESLNRGLDLRILPAVDRGEIFYQIAGRVYARGLESG